MGWKCFMIHVKIQNSHGFTSIHFFFQGLCKILRILPEFNDFIALARTYNVISLYADRLFDLDTPVSAYIKVALGEDYSYLLESVEGSEKWGRYSFIGIQPEIIIRSRQNQIEHIENGEHRTLRVSDPFAYLDDMLKKFRAHSHPELPRFYGGFVGHIGYDAVRFIERLPETAPASTGSDDIHLVLVRNFLAFDNLQKRICIVHNVHVNDPLGCASSEGLKKRYEDASREIERIATKLNEPLNMGPLIRTARMARPTQSNRPAAEQGSLDMGGTLKVRSNFTRQGFCTAVLKAKEYIRAGDVIQVVLSQRLEIDQNGRHPFNIYRALRAVNPSPYMFYLHFPEYDVTGASPELLVRLENGKIELRPIAGTRPRGKTPQEDMDIEGELLRDPKELAEHLMLLDLGRNDVGRVARIGSVRVTAKMFVERYSHVMHIVSNIVGEMADGKNAIDVLKAAFPAGTLTGAPKVRAMEIIEELEGLRRGIYGGAVGYFGYNGNMDMGIAIRTLMARDGKIYIQVGAGIVFDSEPDREFEETYNKAKAVLQAIELSDELT
jgi:anthranilate synthase component 1